MPQTQADIDINDNNKSLKDICINIFLEKLLISLQNYHLSKTPKIPKFWKNLKTDHAASPKNRIQHTDFPLKIPKFHHFLGMA
ncbi:MAG: hypothetical protein HFJ83_00055 [Muribaculaceae bacterium]|nr:hypothetical protein [Muribaculaceae bacterium]